MSGQGRVDVKRDASRGDVATGELVHSTGVGTHGASADHRAVDLGRQRSQAGGPNSPAGATGARVIVAASIALAASARRKVDADMS
jgi:hypothetical protein